MIIDMKDLQPRERYHWMTASIVPRPIAFTSTLSLAGIPNLAPFSYFSGVAANPPILSIAIGRKRGGIEKDTLRNVRDTRELVVNLVATDMAEAMVKCAAEWPHDRSEFEVSGLTPTPSVLVRAPRVKEARLALECRLHEIVEVATTSSIVLAEILLIHARDDVVVDGLPDPAALDPLARLGSRSYAPLGRAFDLEIPRVEP
jgi:flavin reductase (DIM6/NTAB) family NADH-FMN oxidoreductase RutF